MPVRLITYDLNKESTSRDYQGILEFIKQHNWARLSESTYAIETLASPQYIVDTLSQFLDSNDDILVLTLNNPKAGRHSSDVINWIENKLPLHYSTM